MNNLGKGISIPLDILNFAYGQLGYKITQLRKNWEILRSYCDKRELRPLFASKVSIEIRLFELEKSFANPIKSDDLYWALDCESTALKYELLYIKKFEDLFDLNF